MILEQRPLAEITREALQVLYREIGVADTIRFINQFTTGSGNYTEERDALFANDTLEELVAQMRQIEQERQIPDSK